MLYLSRKVGESIIINNAITLTVVEVKGRAVKLGFVFPENASILRQELYERIRDENTAAAANADKAAFDAFFDTPPESDGSA